MAICDLTGRCSRLAGVFLGWKKWGLRGEGPHPGGRVGEGGAGVAEGGVGPRNPGKVCVEVNLVGGEGVEVGNG